VERLGAAGLARDRIVAVLSKPGAGRRLTDRIKELKKAELAAVYQRMKERDLPSMAETPQGCKDLATLIVRANEECVNPTTIGLFYMKRSGCEDGDAPVPELPKPDEYAARCLERGALWAVMMPGNAG
jgi:hypothetical protein